MKRASLVLQVALISALPWLPVAVLGQVNTGSDGSDGAFNPTDSVTIDMSDHPTGIYQYTSVNISNGVMVTFTPNPNNTPVVWLVQSNVTISGTVSVNGKSPQGTSPGLGGPGGYRGGTGGAQATSGQGPGGGGATTSSQYGGNASYATLGGTTFGGGGLPGSLYGNDFLNPLLGGSGGGGAVSSGNSFSGGGGGGAILIAASGAIQLNSYNSITALGGSGTGSSPPYAGGYGSGGAVRLVASTITGSGSISSTGIGSYYGCGNGRVRFDTYLNNFVGTVYGVFSQGSQFVLIPTNGPGTQLTISSVGGVPVSTSPTGVLTTPDVLLSAQQNNPISIVVSCTNVPLNTQITVTVTPVNGAPVSASGYNLTGTLASSAALISISMPRGGGLLSASATTGN